MTILIGLFAPVLVAASAKPAMAAVGCWGDWCSGKDPLATGCSADAYDLASVLIPSTGAYVELRWSPTCKTEWTRVPVSWGLSSPGSMQAVQPSTGYTQIGFAGYDSTYAWGPMIYSPTRCVYAAWVGPPGTISTWCV